MENEILENESPETKWQPIERVQRRLLGVLAEKAKTTPDSYPLTLNAITTASNQKSNRHPQMQLELDEVDEQLDNLRELGAVVEIQGDGRKSKYKHRLYDWLGVDKVELAVMAELLLRGQQTLGDLRARASRMERIEGQSELKPIVRALIDRGLVIELTPAGRGQIVTHSLYMPEELAKLERELGSASAPVASAGQASAAVPATEKSNRSDSNQDTGLLQAVAELSKTVATLTERVARLEERLEQS